MKKRWFFVGVALLLLSLLMVGCGISQAKYDTAVADLGKAQQELQSVKAELDGIKKVYPARYFSTLTELRNWLTQNDISERPASETAESLFAKALDLQDAALAEGYIISAFIEYWEEEDTFFIGCKAVIDGNIYSWDVETDEPVDFSDEYSLGRVR
jgi:hypothetical protein